MVSQVDIHNQLSGCGCAWSTKQVVMVNLTDVHGQYSECYQVPVQTLGLLFGLMNATALYHTNLGSATELKDMILEIF